MIRRQTAPSRALQHAASLFLLLLLLSSLSSSYAKGLGRRRRQMPSLWLYKKVGVRSRFHPKNLKGIFV
jgi:hypothetical protein